jgi:hypothetical protein
MPWGRRQVTEDAKEPCFTGFFSCGRFRLSSNDMQAFAHVRKKTTAGDELEKMELLERWSSGEME